MSQNMQLQNFAEIFFNTGFFVFHDLFQADVKGQVKMLKMMTDVLAFYFCKTFLSIL